MRPAASPNPAGAAWKFQILNIGRAPVRRAAPS